MADLFKNLTRVFNLWLILFLLISSSLIAAKEQELPVLTKVRAQLWYFGVESSLSNLSSPLEIEGESTLPEELTLGIDKVQSK